MMTDSVLQAELEEALSKLASSRQGDDERREFEQKVLKEAKRDAEERLHELKEAKHTMEDLQSELARLKSQKTDLDAELKRKVTSPPPNLETHFLNPFSLFRVVSPLRLAKTLMRMQRKYQPSRRSTPRPSRSSGSDSLTSTKRTLSSGRVPPRPSMTAVTRAPCVSQMSITQRRSPRSTLQSPSSGPSRRVLNHIPFNDSFVLAIQSFLQGLGG